MHRFITCSHVLFRLVLCCVSCGFSQSSANCGAPGCGFAYWNQNCFQIPSLHVLWSFFSWFCRFDQAKTQHWDMCGKFYDKCSRLTNLLILLAQALVQKLWFHNRFSAPLMSLFNSLATKIDSFFQSVCRNWIFIFIPSNCALACIFFLLLF